MMDMSEQAHATHGGHGDHGRPEAHGASEASGTHGMHDMPVATEEWLVFMGWDAVLLAAITKGRVKAAGRTYPEGTIAGDGFDPESAETIGRWLCRGWFLLNEDRPEPYVTTQEYVLREIRPDRLYPPDQLASSGMEGAEDHNAQAPSARSSAERAGASARRAKSTSIDSAPTRRLWLPGSARTQLPLCVQAHLTTPVREEVN